MGFFNKYPFTDFHELNADWIINQISTFQTQVNELKDRMTAAEAAVSALESRVTSAEEDIADLKPRMTTAEGAIEDLEQSMTTAQDDIADLKPRMTTAEGKIEDLEQNVNAINDTDIMDATMLSSVGAIQATSTEVQIPFVRDTYEDGAKDSPSGSQTATIPAATTAAAGVMLPDEKSVLNKFNLQNDGLHLDSRLILDLGEPITNNEAATKGYVDDLAISGATAASSVALTAAGWNSTRLTHNSGHVNGRTYGRMKRLEIDEEFTVAQAVSGEYTLATGTLNAAYSTGSVYQRNSVIAQIERNGSYSYIPLQIVVQTLSTNTTSILIRSLPGTELQVGDIIYFPYANIVYIEL